MSFEAISWALEHSPVTCPYERLLLVCLARRANADGADAYPSRRSLAAAGLCDKSTVTRKLGALKGRGLIREGDQRAANRIPEHLRPKVYDIQIPYSYYSPEQLARVNRERADRGLGPLTPANRPDLASAPDREPRADKGKPKKARSRGGGASSTPTTKATTTPVLPPSEGGASSTRVLEVPEGGASSTPNLSCKSVLSLSSPSGATAPHERETDAPQETTSPPANQQPAEHQERLGQKSAPQNDVPQQRETTTAVPDQELVTWAATLPGQPGRQSVRRLAAQAASALAEGWTLPALRDYLTARCDIDRVHSPAGVYAKHLADLPAPPSSSGARGGRAGGRPTPDCPTCFGTGRAEDPETRLPVGPCPCTQPTAAVPAT